MRSVCGALLFSTFASCTALTTNAQESLRAPDGGTSYHVAGVDLLPVPGHPFTAQSRIDWDRTLGDGTTVKLHLDANLARDGQGRMYREQRGFYSGDHGSSRLITILLYDPIALTKTTCSAATKHCTVTSYHPPRDFTPIPAGVFAEGSRSLAREDLGRSSMDGLDVTGTKETLTINAGAVGNDKPLVTTKEFWYSPDLLTNLAVTRNDPRQGLQSIHLSNVSRSEPDPQIFAVPSGFTVQEVTQGN